MRPSISSRCVCDAATEHIRIGPFMFHWSQASNLELRVLYKLHHQIRNGIRLPVSADWIERLSGDPSTCHPLQHCRSWSGVNEAIARCVWLLSNMRLMPQSTVNVRESSLKYLDTPLLLRKRLFRIIDGISRSLFTITSRIGLMTWL